MAIGLNERFAYFKGAIARVVRVRTGSTLRSNTPLWSCSLSLTTAHVTQRTLRSIKHVHQLDSK